MPQPMLIKSGEPLFKEFVQRLVQSDCTLERIREIEFQATACWSERLLTDEQYQEIREQAHARGKRQNAALVSTGLAMKLRSGMPLGEVVKKALPTAANLPPRDSEATETRTVTKTVTTRFISQEEREARLANLRERRRIARLAPWEATFAADYTPGQQAALSVILFDCRRKGFCDAPVQTIATRAHVSERIVQQAVKLASATILAVRRRLRNTNFITVQLAAILEWWKRLDLNLTESPSSLSVDTKIDSSKGAETCNPGPVASPDETTETSVHAPEPKPIMGPPKPTAETVAFDALIHRLTATVKAEAAQRQDEQDRAAQDAWERPIIQVWMTSLQRAFIKRWNGFLILEPAKWPKIYENSNNPSNAMARAGMRWSGTPGRSMLVPIKRPKHPVPPPLKQEVLDWLVTHYGSSGVNWGFCGFTPPGASTPTPWLGFENSRNAVEFSMNWRGA